MATNAHQTHYEDGVPVGDTKMTTAINETASKKYVKSSKAPIKSRLKFHMGDGTKQTWHFYASRLHGAWVLEEPDGYCRILEQSWRESVPRIREIAANYGAKVDVS